MHEPPLYRPFALFAFAATLAGGTPVGLWIASWLHLGTAAVPLEWILLHASLQLFGFFGVLIPGVAHHVLPRFTGRPVARHAVTPWLAGLLAAALVLRVAGTWSRSPDAVLVASLLHAAAFALFALWVWRSLDPPELAPLRRHLTLATGWLALACLVEVALRWRALGLPLPVPDLGGMRAVHAMGIFGGVAGWVVGVLLRAGPMFIAGWSVPSGIARAAPWLLALGAATAAVGEASRESAVARLGEFVALGGVGAIMLAGGALGRARRVLPMTARSPEEARIFRLAAVSAGVAVPGGALAALLAWAGVPIHLLTDALRHLVTVGFLASVVVAMAFRLIPVLEGAALPWPALRHVAFWALLASVLGRSAEVLVGVGGRGIAPLVPLSGLLAWIALACVAANLAGAIARLRGAPPA